MSRLADNQTDEPNHPAPAEGAVTTGAPTLAPARARLCLWLLVLLGFALGCAEFVVIGIEPEIAADFHVTLARAGELVSWFAGAYAVMTPALALGTGRFRRFPLLVAYGVVFCGANLAALVAPTFGLLLASRLLIGSVAGALLATAVTFVPELVSPSRASMAIALVYGAFSVAMVLVTSLGKIAATVASWRVVMAATFVLSLVTIALLVAFLPRTGATDEPSTVGEQLALLRDARVIVGMLIFVFGVGAVYVFYAYVTPYLQNVLGMTAGQASVTLLAYGAMTILSNMLSGWGDARFGLRSLAVTFPLQAVLLVTLWALGPRTPGAVAVIMLIALSMYVISTPCVSLFLRVARTRHPKALTLASSVEPTAFNIGIAFGTAIGGVIVDGPGLRSVGVVGAAFALVAFALTIVTMRIDARARREDRERSRA